MGTPTFVTLTDERGPVLNASGEYEVQGSDGMTVRWRIDRVEVLDYSVPDLKAMLDEHGVDEVVICGAMSHMCGGRRHQGCK